MTALLSDCFGFTLSASIWVSVDIFSSHFGNLPDAGLIFGCHLSSKIWFTCKGESRVFSSFTTAVYFVMLGTSYVITLHLKKTAAHTRQMSSTRKLTLLSDNQINTEGDRSQGSCLVLLYVWFLLLIKTKPPLGHTEDVDIVKRLPDMCKLS